MPEAFNLPLKAIVRSSRYGTIVGNAHRIELDGGNMKTRSFALLLALLAVTGIGLRGARADIGSYNSIVDLRADGDTFIVKHHHDWSQATEASRYQMITTHQDPFRADNDYANIAWYSRDNGRRLRMFPSPALTWLGVSRDSRYVIGLSNVKLHNPYQLVVYNRAGELLLKRHIGDQVACLTPAKYRELRHSHSRQFEILNERIWTKDGVVYVDFLTMEMPTRLGLLWDTLYAFVCPSPFSPNFSESVTNWVDWYDEKLPAPVVIENAGQPVAIRLKDPKGIEFTMPFRLAQPSQ
jgi:hypothetical protein